LNDIQTIDEIMPVSNFFIIGSILTKKYTATSDIDICIEVDSGTIEAIDLEKILFITRKMNGRYAPGTTHKINYYIVKDEYDLDKTDGAYDVANDKWIKIPKDTDIDMKYYTDYIETHINQLSSATEDLRQCLIDIEEIKQLPTHQLNYIHGYLQQKLDRLNNDVITIITVYDSIKTLRKKSYSKFMTPEEIKIWGGKNNLPENIVYKVLQKYYYDEFASALKAIIDSRSVVHPTDIPKIKDAGKDLWR
jgi:predicted nucleotidyltransferase